MDLDSPIDSFLCTVDRAGMSKGMWNGVQDVRDWVQKGLSPLSTGGPAEFGGCSRLGWGGGIKRASISVCAVGMRERFV